MLCVGGGVIKELALGTLPEWILTGGGGVLLGERPSSWCRLHMSASGDGPGP